VSRPATPDPLPDALERIDEIRERARGRPLAVFLDYDGTLSPTADRPDLATLPEAMREAVAALSGKATVAIVSGRDLRNLRHLISIPGIFYVGSHGFEMEGPDGRRLDDDPGGRCLPALGRAEDELHEALDGIPGSLVERKRFSVAVHYRLVSAEDRPAIEQAVSTALARHGELRRADGKMVYELRPAVEWDKGTAVLRLLEILGGDPLPVYVGDDITDEDAFRALQSRGVGVVVSEERRPTAATYRLHGTDAVRSLLQELAG